MSLWMLALPLTWLAVSDYRAVSRDGDLYRARLHLWRARGAAFAAMGVLIPSLTGIVVRHAAFLQPPIRGLDLLAIVALTFGVGLTIVVVSSIGLATYARYGRSRAQ